GSGFIAAHVLETLLSRGHSVVTTVSSQQEAEATLQAHGQLPRDRLDCVIVEDIAKPNAIMGTTGILKSVQQRAPTVKRVVVTSSFAAINNVYAKTAGKVYSEERVAWEFVEKKMLSFTLSVINPPLRIRDLITAVAKERCPLTGNYGYVVLAHVLAVEKEEAGGKRFFAVSSHFSDKTIADIIGQEFPQFRDRPPTGDTLASGDYPADGV
ncbi:NAD(P)-binding protein, partial [Penicillium alfredii]